jgi:hypothetical protein
MRQKGGGDARPARGAPRPRCVLRAGGAARSARAAGAPALAPARPAGGCGRRERRGARAHGAGGRGSGRAGRHTSPPPRASCTSRNTLSAVIAMPTNQATTVDTQPLACTPT